MRLTFMLAVSCALLSAQGPAIAQSEATQDAVAVNKAGRQRMLTQRIVKLYCQVGMDVAAGAARPLLAESVALFERQLADLEPLARSPETRNTLSEMRQLWLPVKTLATGSVTKDGALQLHAASESLLDAAHRLTIQFEAGATLAALVNRSGRQRMVSQRLAKMYMLLAWGVDLPGLGAEMDAMQAEFTGALGRLMRAGENTTEIDRELYAIAVQWEWFKSALAFEGIASYGLVVADASEAILRSLERVVHLYERVGAR